MNILLVYPGLIEGFDSYTKGSNWFNHGIGIISSILKKEGHSIEYMDCRKFSGWDAVRNFIRLTEFDSAMISIATVDFEAAQLIAEIIKEKNPALKVMVGGPHPTLMTDQTLSVENFDYIFTHEAEKTLPELLREGQKISRTTRGEMPLDLDALPFVDRSLAPEGESSWFKGLDHPYFQSLLQGGVYINVLFANPLKEQFLAIR